MFDAMGVIAVGGGGAMPAAVLGLTFLAPAAGIVAGALGAAGVLVFYFLKLRRRPVRVSTVMFWEEVASDLQVNAPFQMVRPSLLLLLQLMVVALLAAALARPAMDRPIASRDVFIVLDRSASMNATDGPGGATRLEEAKRLAVEFLERVPSDARVSVLAFAGDARSVVDGSSNAREVRRAVEGLGPTHQPADVTTALRVLSAFVNRGGEGGDGEDSARPPLVAIVSDGNFAVEGVEGPPLGGADVRFVRVGPAPTEGEGGVAVGVNAGVVAVAAKRDFDDPALVRVFVRASLNRPAARASLTLTATLDGAVVGTRSAAVASNGEASHTFRVQAPRGGLLTVSIEGEDDALSADDVASVLLLPPELPSVLLVRGEESGRGAGSFALQDALEALDVERVEAIDASAAGERGLIGADARGAIASAGYDLAVFDGVSPRASPSVPTISFDASLPGGPVGLGERRREETVAFAYWRRDHPVMRAVSLGDVLVDEPTVLTLDADEAEGGGGERSAIELASAASGPLIAMSEGGGGSRLFVGFGLDRTNWWRFPSFPLFIANAVDHLALRPESRTGLSGRTGERLTISMPREFAGERLVLVGPGEARETLTVAPNGRAVGEPPRLTGVYRVEQGDDAAGGPAAGLPPAVPVNLLDARETSLVVAGSLPIGGRETSAETVAGVAPAEIWHWFVIAAAVVLTAEWLLFTRRMSL